MVALREKITAWLFVLNSCLQASNCRMRFRPLLGRLPNPRTWLWLHLIYRRNSDWEMQCTTWIFQQHQIKWIIRLPVLWLNEDMLCEHMYPNQNSVSKPRLQTEVWFLVYSVGRQSGWLAGWLAAMTAGISSGAGGIQFRHFNKLTFCQHSWVHPLWVDAFNVLVR